MKITGYSNNMDMSPKIGKWNSSKVFRAARRCPYCSQVIPYTQSTCEGCKPHTESKFDVRI